MEKKLTKDIISLLKSINIKIIKIDAEFDIEPYLCWFTKNDIELIKSHKKKQNQVQALCSILLKKYTLAKLSNVNPWLIKIGFNSYGKPIMDGLIFNISHSDEYVVMATTDNLSYDIGVDIEKIDYEQEDLQNISELVFSKDEQTHINNNNSVESFFMLWSKKEAFLKSLGCGFMTEQYKNTAISLEPISYVNDCLICSFKFENYYVSVCLNRSNHSS